MSEHRRWLVALVALVISALAVSSCGGPTFVIQQYGGPQRPAESVAVIRINGTDRILWASLDGEAAGARVPEDSRFHIEVLPGKHTLGIRSAADAPTAFVSFQAEPGKVYRPVLERKVSSIAPAGGGNPARIYEVDRERDTLLRDVTLPSDDDSERAVTRPAAMPPATASPKLPVENEAGSTDIDAATDGGASLFSDGAARP